MTSPWDILSFLCQAIILLFTCLALGVAFQQARVDRLWLVPLVAGQTLDLLGSLFSIFMMSSIAAQHVSFNQAIWMLIPRQVSYGLGSLSEVWLVVALFLTSKSQVFAPHSQILPPQAP